jgi:hypothetical protein
MDRNCHLCLRARTGAGISAAVLAVVLAALLASCGRRPPTGTDADLLPGGGTADPRAVTPDDVCRILSGEPQRGGNIVIAVAGDVDPARAPRPTNDAERVLFANLYETLTRVACDGELEPGLALRWRRLDAGRRWRLHLRDDAVFWDGTPVTADSVIAAWRRNRALTDRAGEPFAGRWFDLQDEGLQALDRQTLEIRTAAPLNDLPSLLAHRDLAVAAKRPGWLWPVGSGPCRLAQDTDRPLPDLGCRPNQHHPERPVWTSLTFRVMPERDPRDLLGAGIDLALIRDRRAAAYYAQLAAVQSAPLPWDRLYLLAVPPGSDLTAPVATGPLYDLVTPADSRPWHSLFLRDCDPAPCIIPEPEADAVRNLLDPDPVLQAVGQRQLVFLASDPDARALAERVLAFQTTGFSLQAVTAPELAGVLQTGQAAGYITRLDADYPTACLTLGALLAEVPWLSPNAAEEFDPCRLAASLRRDGWLIPLAATRAQLVWSAPLAGLNLARDGTPLVGGLGRARPEAAP